MTKNSEFGFIEQIKSLFLNLGDENIEGIGDDCAIIPVSEDESFVITTDILVEDVHFLISAISAYELGRKSLAVNLSDVASMGSRAVASMLSIAVSSELRGEWLSEFMRGYHSLSLEHNVKLIGGDTSSSKGKIAINVVAIGRVENKNIKKRSAAKVGDGIYVVGKLGESAKGLQDILHGDNTSYLAKIHNTPRAQLLEGEYLGGCSEVNAMIDLSDGLASDLGHILELSGVDARVDLDAVPTDFDYQTAVCGGEDYKLLFTSKDEKFMENYKGEQIYKIGEIIAKKDTNPKIHWILNGCKTENDWKGFTHF
ncbi:MAG: thiamine-phosphate kinase [Rikenellaceae bacterium]